jgi:hypothetical protein
MLNYLPIKNSKKLIELNSYQIRSLIEPQVECSLYLFASTIEGLDKESDIEFTENEAIWNKLIESRLKRTDRVIKLQKFYLFEWFPRCPGLYYTENGRYARHEAKRNIISTKNGTTVYGHHGKLSMLNGGIGSIRLLPIKIEGSKYYLMSASSNGNCDEGFPVAVPEHLYNKLIDRIIDDGAVLVDLYGKLISVPNDITDVFAGYLEVPKLLLKIDSISEPYKISIFSKSFIVNIAVSFVSEFERKKRVYASFVSFNPSNPKSFKESIKWLERDYVGDLYKGKIITDFDQTMEHFENAPFSLKKIMSFELNKTDIKGFPTDYHLDHYLDNSVQGQEKLSFYYNQINIEIVEKKQIIKDSTNVIIVGDNSNVSHISQHQNIAAKDIDLQSLAAEIEKLRIAAKKESTTLEHDFEIGNLAAAEAAARAGDQPKALSLMAKAGKWTLDIATKIGVGLAVAAIKQVILP